LAADPNGGAVTYPLADNAGGRFAIDAETGLVTVANGSRLDYETATSHDIVVAARDASGATSTAAFTVAVANGGGATINGSADADLIDRTHTVPGEPLPTNEDDTIYGNAGNDTIHARGGNDILIGGAGADMLFGGAGNDTASYEKSNDGVHVSLMTGIATGGHAEGDTLIDIENLTGSSRADTLEGDSGDNVLSGGEGNDTLSYEHATAGVRVDMNKTAAQDTVGSGMDTVTGFQYMIGSHFDDALAGDKQANAIRGLDGNDAINGGAGNDMLIGSAGDDRLTGGSGADAFIFDFSNEGLDTITDFTSKSDYLQISASGFGGGLVAGTAATLVTTADIDDAFFSGDSGYFIFDNAGDDAGTVYWDGNGGNGEDAVAFVKLASGVSPLPTDIHLV
jgi:Ca2+-binding RTX toxin-like protein